MICETLLAFKYQYWTSITAELNQLNIIWVGEDAKKAEAPAAAESVERDQLVEPPKSSTNPVGKDEGSKDSDSRNDQKNKIRSKPAKPALGISPAGRTDSNWKITSRNRK